MADNVHTSRLRYWLRAAVWSAAAAWLTTFAHAAGEADPTAEEIAAERKQVNGAELGDGRLIRVRLPLTGNADAHIKSAIQRAVDQLSRAPRDKSGRRPILVLEIEPARRHGSFGEGSDFSRALSLAEFVSSPELSGVKTVAYLPQTIKGHGILVAMACEEIVMHPEAEIGDAGVDENDRDSIADRVSSYRQIAKKRLTVPEAIALGMLDRQLEVFQVETDQGTEFVLGDGLEQLEQRHTIASKDLLVSRGSLGSFSGREGREFGFVKLLASNRDELARGLALPPEDVIEDQSLVGDWRPVMIEIEGPITPRKVHQVQTLIGNQISEQHVNWIGLRIDSSGGEIEDSLRLADSLAALDANEVRTVAYVPVEASGSAALVALACHQLVMAPDAHVGGKGSLELDRSTLDAAAVTVRESLAEKTDHSWSLLAACLDPDLDVFSYQNNTTGEVRFFSEEEAAEQPDADAWRRGAKITSDDEPLRLGSRQAQELGIAWHVVENFDELKQLYGFEHDPRVAEPNWALELVEALSSPALTVVLLVIGFIGIYIELHTPGVGIGGFVAALAFMLFFWSKYLHGTAGWLEVLLFVGGVMCLLLELLVLPGFGVFGLGGGAMILASLVLASQTFILPQTESQLAELRQSLTVIAAAAACMLIAAIAVRHYLPRSPVFRTLLLDPPADEELVDLDYRESVADFSYLVGEQGTAATNLMPSGKAEFEGQLVDVIADGMPIDRGQPVVVVKARGNRVLVRAVEA